MSSDTTSSLFRGMAVVLARIRTQEKHLERLRAELAFVSFSAEHGDATAVACRDELLGGIVAVEAHLGSLRAALADDDRKAAEARQRVLALRDRL
ncbi:MAG: hypothetical protein NFCOHLIN_03189 [Gammaproteobacteria bacterium]|nr:hypothetical protein [Gammaproteobacteria bacterium]